MNWKLLLACVAVCGCVASGPIQPRDFTPKADNDCDIWPSRAAICEAPDGHTYIGGVRFDAVYSVDHCAFKSNKDGDWAVSDYDGGLCTVNGKHFNKTTAMNGEAANGTE